MDILNYQMDLAKWIRALATRLDGRDPEGARVSYLNELRASERVREVLSRTVNALQSEVMTLEASLNEYNARLAEETRLRQEAERKLIQSIRTPAL